MTPGGPSLEFLDDPDLVRDTAALRELLQRFGPAPPHDPTSEETEKLAALHETLRRLAEVVASGRLPSQGELADLNEILETPLRLRLVAGEAALTVESTPVAAGWATIVRELAGSFADLLVDHDPSRLRRCANPGCGRFFYDESRSGKRRWHDAACGNLVRVRRFRSK